MIYFLPVAIITLIVIAYILFKRRARNLAESREIIMGRAFAKILDGAREDVLQEMRRLYQMATRDLGIGIALGSLFRHLGKNRMAIRMHQGLLTRPEIDPNIKSLVLTELSADFLACGLMERARQSIEEALTAREPDELMARYGERIFAKLHEWDHAVQLVKRYGKACEVDVQQRIALLRFEQGLDLWREDLRDEAYKVFKKAYGVDAYCLPAYLYTSRYYRENGKPKKARAFLEKRMGFFTDLEWLAMRERMTIAIQMEDHSVFIDAVNAHLEKRPEDWRSRAILGDFLVELGDLAEAMEAYLACLKASPQTVMLHRKLWRLIARGDEYGSPLFKSYLDLIDKDVVFQSAYACKVCNYQSAEFLWRCPSCFHIHGFQERRF